MLYETVRPWNRKAINKNENIDMELEAIRDQCLLCWQVHVALIKTDVFFSRLPRYSCLGHPALQTFIFLGAIETQIKREKPFARFKNSDVEREEAGWNSSGLG